MDAQQWQRDHRLVLGRLQRLLDCLVERQLDYVGPRERHRQLLGICFLRGESVLVFAYRHCDGQGGKPDAHDYGDAARWRPRPRDVSDDRRRDL